MSNVVEQLTPNPVTHEHGENGCCPDTRAWEMEMMHQVWAAGLHDAANCFQDALKAKWELESQRKVKPKTNGDKIRAMTDEELAKSIVRHFLLCEKCFFKRRCEKDPAGVCIECALTFLRSPVEDGEK